MVDSKHQNRFSINSSGEKVFALNNRTGILENVINEMEIESDSKEFGSLELINEYLNKNKKKNIIKFDHKFNNQFTASKILRENQDILKTLDELKLYKWELISKTSSFKKFIKNRDKKLLENEFNHFSISIMFKLGKDLPNIEIGVGTTDNFNINRDGLNLRIKDIVKNNRELKNIEFKERVPVILDSGDGGILFHEIIGHSLEADYIAKKISPFSINDIGKQIFPEALTVNTYDKKDTFFSGTHSDDEGQASNNSELIKAGVLNRILTDNFHNDLLKLPNSGSARTEDFTKVYQPRMHSIFIKPGNYNPEELISSVKYGVFAKEFGEGKVFFTNNTFSIIIQESYLIENGKITSPLGTIVLNGNIREVLDSVNMIGNDFRYDRGISYCYKNGQTLNVRVGQPSIKIENITVSRKEKW